MVPGLKKLPYDNRLDYLIDPEAVAQSFDGWLKGLLRRLAGLSRLAWTLSGWLRLRQIRGGLRRLTVA